MLNVKKQLHVSIMKYNQGSQVSSQQAGGLESAGFLNKSASSQSKDAWAIFKKLTVSFHVHSNRQAPQSHRMILWKDYKISIEIPLGRRTRQQKGDTNKNVRNVETQSYSYVRDWTKIRGRHRQLYDTELLTNIATWRCSIPRKNTTDENGFYKT